MTDSLKVTVEAPFDLTRLEVSENTVLLVNTPLADNPAYDALAQRVGEAIEREVREQTGKKVAILMAGPGTTIEAIPPEALEKLGWVRGQTLEEQEDTVQRGG